METAKPIELNTLHVGKIRTTHGSKSHHGLRKWNSSLHHASSLKSFRTAYSHEGRNCITGEGNDTANARMLAAYEKAFACYDSCPESERYRTSVFLVGYKYKQDVALLRSIINNNNNNNLYLYSAMKSNQSNCSVALYNE